MAITEEQFAEFKKLQEIAAIDLSKQSLKDNPTVTYGQLLRPSELELAAILYSPELKAKAAGIYTSEKMIEIENAVDWQKRVAPYNRKPIEYDMNERHPEYVKQVAEFESPEGRAKRQEIKIRGNYPDDYEPFKPTEPLGLEKAKKIAARGFDPENKLQFKTFGDGFRFRSKLAFAPRNTTIEDFKYLGKQHGLVGDYMYINPSDPSDGLAFMPDGSDDPQLLNTPFVTAEDTYNFLVQEFPALAGDVGLTVYGSKKFTSPFGLSDKLGGKVGKVLGLSGLSAAGAAGGDFIRLTAGSAMGAHDRDFDDILKESGMIGAWAFGGTAVISGASTVIPKVWKMVTGKDVPPSFYEKIDDAMQEARAAERGEGGLPSGILYGDATSVKQINDQIEELGKRFKIELENYNPTIASAAGTQGAADLETLFLKYADDSELRETYKQIKLGNQEVIDRFVSVLNKNIGPDTTGEATGATLGAGIRALAQKDVDAFNDQAYDMIDQVRLQVGGAEDAAIAGQTLLKQVDNPNASSGPLFPRQQARLNQIKQDYITPYNQAWNNALANPRYTDLKTGAGFTRKPANEWMNLRKGEANKLFRSAESDESVKLLYEQIPAGTKNTLNRLRGIGPQGKGGFESPNFNLKELNDARISLNEFASTTNNVTAVKQSRQLERGLEEQMNQLLREGAASESGIPVTRKVELQNWMDQNQYGDDLKLAWSQQKEAIQLANSQSVRSILEQRPEKVAEYLFNTTAKGSKQNTVVNDLMTLLKRDGSDEILEIQNGLAEYVQREILSNPDKTPFQIAKEFRKFVKDQEGTLKAVFGEKDFVSRFNNPKGFNKIIKQIENTNQNIAQLQARFGLADIGEPDKVVTNIVESILATGKTQKQSGRILQDIEYLATVTKNNPELKEQIAQVTKRYLLQDIITARPGGGFKIDNEGLNKLIKEGFGPEEVTGPRLTFESFISPLLGKKEGKEFIKNLTILDNMVQREVGVEASEGIQRIISGGEYVVGNNLEGARMLQRLLIAPLTQTGRRITAISTRQAETSRKLIGRMLLDPELFEQVMRMAQGRESTQKMIRILTSYGMVAANDIGNEMKYYDTTDKAQKTPEPETSALDRPVSFDHLLNLLGA